MTTQLRGTDVYDGSICRTDLNVLDSGSAVIRKIIEVASSGIKITASTGADTGTGDVKLAVDTAVVQAKLNGTGLVRMTGLSVGYDNTSYYHAGNSNKDTLDWTARYVTAAAIKADSEVGFITRNEQTYQNIRAQIIYSQNNGDSTLWNAKQAALNGTGLVRMEGTNVSYDNTSYYHAGNLPAYPTNADTLDGKHYSDITSDIAQSKSVNFGYRYSYTLWMYGEHNKYYPFTIAGGDQDLKRDILIKRSYGETHPPEWYLSTHGGGLTVKIKTNFGGWGGANYSWEIHELEEMYNSTFAGCYVTNSYMTFSIMLRGGGVGGAIYHVYSDQPIEITHPLHLTSAGGTTGAFPVISYNSDNYQYSNGTYFWNMPAPLTTPNTEDIRIRKFIALTQALDSSKANWNTAYNHSLAAHAPILVNPITGTGTRTAGYIPKFNADVNTLSDSPIYTDGTNVGIGTTDPQSYKLHVDGDIKATARVIAGTIIEAPTLFLKHGLVDSFVTQAGKGTIQTAPDQYKFWVAGVGADMGTPFSISTTSLSAERHYLLPDAHGTFALTTDIANSGNWNTAYGWGNHAGLYSLLNHTHSTYAATDQTFYIGTTQIAINRTSSVQTLTGINIDGSAASLGGISAEKYVHGSNESGQRSAPLTWDAYHDSQRKGGFWEIVGSTWAPTVDWWWGITAPHSSNGAAYNYSGQLIFNLAGTESYFRSISGGTANGWRKIWHDGNSNLSTVDWTARDIHAAKYFIGTKQMLSDYSWGGANNNIWIGSVNTTVTGTGDQGNYNIAIGELTLGVNTTGFQNIAIGAGALKSNTTGSYNYAIGDNALRYNTAGVQNMAVGGYSLASNTTGGYNLALGVNALKGNVSGSYNTGVGYCTLYAATGSNNTAIGFYSGWNITTGSENTGVGVASNNGLTTGSGNTVIGHGGLRFNTASSYNVAIGWFAGRYINAGTNNTAPTNSVFIGDDCRALNANDDNQIVIGHLAVGHGSNTATWGNTSILNNYFSGKVNASSYYGQVVNLDAGTFSGYILGAVGTTMRWIIGSDIAITGTSDNDLDLYSYTGNVQIFASTVKKLTVHSTGIDVAGNASATGYVKGASLRVTQTAGTGAGLSLYGDGDYTQSYGIWCGGTSGNTFGSVTGDWGMYFSMEGAANRGWLFKHSSTGVAASISAGGDITTKGSGTFQGGGFNSIRSLKIINEDWAGNATAIISKFILRDFNYRNMPNQNRTLGFIIDEIPEEIQPYALFGENRDAINIYSFLGLTFKAHQETKTELELQAEKIISLEAQVRELQEGRAN